MRADADYGVKVALDGRKFWLRYGVLHREDGPAVEALDGGRAWYRNGQLHREDGPAVELPDGRREWYRNGQLHRAVIPMRLTDGRPQKAGDLWDWRLEGF